MQKSFDGLSIIAKHHLHKITTSGDLFVFVNRNRTYMKVLYFDGDGDGAIVCGANVLNAAPSPVYNSKSCNGPS